MLHAVHDMEPVRALVKPLRERLCTVVNLLCDVSVELRQQMLDRRVKNDAVREGRSEVRLPFPFSCRDTCDGDCAPMRTATSSWVRPLFLRWLLSAKLSMEYI
jgi:hypothetical protein